VRCSSSARRSRVLLLLAAVAAVVLSACQVKVTVGVEGRGDGSGRVTVTAALDKDAAAQAGTLALDDLRQAEWTVTGPTATSDGGSVVTASHAFANAGELTSVVGQLAGANGPFRDFRLTHRNGLFVSHTRFTGTVDLSPGLAAFGDEGLRKQLGGPGIGLDPAAVKAATGVDLDKLVGFRVSVRLPGSVTSSNAPAQAGNGATWSPLLGERVELVASARKINVLPIVLIAVAVALLAAIAVFLVVRRPRRA
jgi:hypothetical protein